MGELKSWKIAYEIIWPLQTTRFCSILRFDKIFCIKSKVCLHGVESSWALRIWFFVKWKIQDPKDTIDLIKACLNLLNFYFNNSINFNKSLCSPRWYKIGLFLHPRKTMHEMAEVIQLLGYYLQPNLKKRLFLNCS
jgi:hypothetical protein